MTSANSFPAKANNFAHGKKDTRKTQKPEGNQRHVVRKLEKNDIDEGGSVLSSAGQGAVSHPFVFLFSMDESKPND